MYSVLRTRVLNYCLHTKRRWDMGASHLFT